MKAYKGTFDANTSTGNQTISGIVDEDGNAFTPKAVLIWGVGTFAAGFADGYNYQIGMTDGTNHLSAEYAGNDNSATSNAAGGSSGSAIARMISSAAAVLRSGTFSSFGSGQFVINWTVVTANAEKFHYFALGGADLTVLTNRQRMDAVRSVLASAPDMVAMITTCAVGNTGCGGMGFVVDNGDGTFTQGLSLPQLRDSVNPSQTRRVQRTDRLRLHLTSSFGTFIEAGWDVLGPAFAVLNTSSGVLSHDLMLGGIAAKGGAGLQPTSTGTQAVTGLGFSPKAVLILSVGATASASVVNEAQLSIGGADRTRQGYTVVGGVNGVSPSVTVKKSDESKIVCGITPNATAASSTTEAEASIQSIDADGFTLNWTSADATQRQYLWLALGDVPAPASGGERSRAFLGVV